MVNQVNWKEDFYVFEHNQSLSYLDSAATTLRPKKVVDSLGEYSKYHHANIHRGAYELSYEATQCYDLSRETIKAFLGGDQEGELIFTYGATDSVNLLMRSFLDMNELTEEDSIVVSIYEHHSNLVPWQVLSQKTGAKLKFIYDFNDLSAIDTSTKIVSISMMSNATGYRIPIEKVVRQAKSVQALIIVDGAQIVGHEKVNVSDLDIDAFVFSGHKMFGPTGIGGLYAKKALLNRLEPYRYGGDMIEYVREQETTYGELPSRFEAGTPNIEGVVGLTAAINYIQSVGMERISEHVSDLRQYAVERLGEVDKLSLVEAGENPGPIISFEIEGCHPHDIASILDNSHIAVRGGHHCAQPLMKYLELVGTTRVSFQIYNTRDDVDRLVEALKTVRRWLGYES